ncbi:RNA-binding protein [Miniphocaeibacter massiliensis]|uniref:YlmH family RNA-binding protein n=1 Tax=Miniphocaeibacter massiliensis TaxID=2041841 RepID=UPI000C080346|nr:YlmH/Sll1252 family protein [Miniphocaeibacter massiliensis]
MNEEYFKILNHINDVDTKQTIKKFIDSLFIVKEKNISYCSDFLTPNEINYCIKSIQTFSNINYEIIPNFEKCERNCILLGNNIEYLDKKEYISFIACGKTTEDVTHRDVLGSILALGVVRSKIGDILIDDKSIYIVVRKSISNYILANLNNIGRNNVEFKIVENIPYENIQDNYSEYSATVSSLRLDVLLSEILNLSRNKVSSVIKSGRVKVNHEELKKIHGELLPGDIISVRGFGRFKFLDIQGKTKKDKFRIKYIKYE